jgi:hypothetical protein
MRRRICGLMLVATIVVTGVIVPVQTAAAVSCTAVPYPSRYDSDWDELRAISFINCTARVKHIYILVRLYRTGSSGGLVGIFDDDEFSNNVIRHEVIKDCIGNTNRTYYTRVSGWYRVSSGGPQVTVAARNSDPRTLPCNLPVV